MLVARFEEIGYKGTIKVEDYSKFFKTGYESLAFTYEEVVEGRSLIFEDRIQIHTDNIPQDDLSNREIDRFIKEGAMWQQEYVQDRMFKIKQTFSQIGTEEFKLDYVEGQKLETLKNYISHWSREVKFSSTEAQKVVDRILQKIDSEKEEFSSLKEDIRKLTWQDVINGREELEGDAKRNRERGLPINGYYNIDVPKYLAKHVLEITVEYVREHPDGEKEDETSTRNRFLDLIESLDYTEFWDGYYSVGFYRKSHSGTRRGSISDTIVLYIKDGKLFKFLLP